MTDREKKIEVLEKAGAAGNMIKTIHEEIRELRKDADSNREEIEKREKKLQELKDFRGRVREEIEKIEDVNLQNILIMRFFLRYQWKQIETEMQISRTTLERRTEKALELVQIGAKRGKTGQNGAICCIAKRGKL